MRVFIALLFENEKRDIINDILGEVRLISGSGNFTAKKNLHLTVLYIGETSSEKLEEIKAVLSGLIIDKFDYKTNRIKYFRKQTSSLIVYLGVEKIEALENLYHEIRHRLKKVDLEFPNKKYTPHITLGRKVKIKKNKSLHNIYTSPLDLKASKISIMESKRVNDKLVYEELFSIPLK